MYIGLLDYFMHVIIAKFGQFNLHKANYLTSVDLYVLKIRLLITCVFFHDVK